MPSNQNWFWTPDRLIVLREVLDGLAQRDEQGLYFGAISLRTQARDGCLARGLEVYESRADTGLAILIYFGVIGRGLPGKKRGDYRRRYYPNAVGPITW